ncbi:MAG: fasciclin domain-containing protein [Phormidesmis sp.]
MQINNSPNFIKSFMVGLIASSAGAFVALPGAAMPEAAEVGSETEAITPVEVISEPTAAETLPVSDVDVADVEVSTEADALTEVAPVEALEEAVAEEAIEEPVAEEAVEETVEEEVAEEAIEEPVAEEAVEETVEEEVAEEAIEEPVAEEAVEETVEEEVAEEAIEEPVAEEAVEETVEEAVAEEAIEEPVAEEAVEETVEEAVAEEAIEEPVAEEAVEETVEEETAAEEMNTEEFTIAELAGNSDSFEILSAALEAAELSEVLSGEGPFTVFAPTDEAFEALPEGAVEQLLLPENKNVLIQVLTYHVVPGAVLSTDLETGAVATVEGSDLAVEVAETVTVNNANVIAADVTASNGVIHVIDSVILPPAPEADAATEEDTASAQ